MMLTPALRPVATWCQRDEHAPANGNVSHNLFLGTTLSTAETPGIDVGEPAAFKFYKSNDSLLKYIIRAVDYKIYFKSHFRKLASIARQTPQASHLSTSVKARALIARFLAKPRSFPLMRLPAASRAGASISGNKPKLTFMG